MDELDKLVDELNRRHGLRFTLRGRCEGGVLGAWLLTDPAGERAILKTNGGMAHRITRLPAIVDRIRAAGYPTPAWLAAGVTDKGVGYHVVEFAPGEPMSGSTLTGPMAAQLVEVIERQAGLDPDPVQAWSSYVRGRAFDEDDTVDHTARPSLRRLGRPGEELLARFDAVLAPYADVELPTGDLVHGDFNTCNVLAEAGEVTAVIDVEAAGSGTRAVDYAWLLREAHVRNAEPGAIGTIRQAGEAVAGPGVLAVCAAATAFDITLFQHCHDPGSMPWTLEGLHRLAADLTRRTRTRSA